MQRKLHNYKIFLFFKGVTPLRVCGLKFPKEVLRALLDSPAFYIVGGGVSFEILFLMPVIVILIFTPASTMRIQFFHISI